MRLAELKILIRSFIVNEGQIDDLKRRYDSHPKKDVIIKTIQTLDGLKPAIVKWAVGQVERGEPHNEVIELVKNFETRFKQKLKDKGKSSDLNSYKTLGDLRGAIEEVGTSTRGQDNSKVRSESDVLYEDESVMLVHPRTKQASCGLGRGTKWCVAATQSQNYFDQYTSEGVFLFYVLPKGELNASLPDTMKKVAFSMTPGNLDFDPDEPVEFKFLGENPKWQPGPNEFAIEIFDASDEEKTFSYFLKIIGRSLGLSLLDMMRNFVRKDPVPKSLRDKYGTMTVEEATEMMRSPPNETENFDEDSPERSLFHNVFVKRYYVYKSLRNKIPLMRPEVGKIVEDWGNVVKNMTVEDVREMFERSPVRERYRDPVFSAYVDAVSLLEATLVGSGKSNNNFRPEVKKMLDKAVSDFTVSHAEKFFQDLARSHKISTFEALKETGSSIPAMYGYNLFDHGQGPIQKLYDNLFRSNRDA